MLRLAAVQLPWSREVRSSGRAIFLRGEGGDVLYRGGVAIDCPAVIGPVAVVSDDAIVSSAGSEYCVAPFVGGLSRFFTMPQCVCVHFTAGRLFAVVETASSAAVVTIGSDGVRCVSIERPGDPCAVTPGANEFYINGADWNVIKVCSHPVLRASSHPLECEAPSEVGKMCCVGSMLMVEELGSWLVLVVDVDDYMSLLYTIDLRDGQPYEDIAVHDMMIASAGSTAATCLVYSEALIDDLGEWCAGPCREGSSVQLWHMSRFAATLIAVVPHPSACTIMHMTPWFFYLAGANDAVTYTFLH